MFANTELNDYLLGSQGQTSIPATPAVAYSAANSWGTYVMGLFTQQTPHADIIKIEATITQLKRKKHYILNTRKGVWQYEVNYLRKYREKIHAWTTEDTIRALQADVKKYLSAHREMQIKREFYQQEEYDRKDLELEELKEKLREKGFSISPELMEKLNSHLENILAGLERKKNQNPMEKRGFFKLGKDEPVLPVITTIVDFIYVSDKLFSEITLLEPDVAYLRREEIENYILKLEKYNISGHSLFLKFFTPQILDLLLVKITINYRNAYEELEKSIEDIAVIDAKIASLNSLIKDLSVSEEDRTNEETSRERIEEIRDKYIYRPQ
jgi:hypothetical protein